MEQRMFSHQVFKRKARDIIRQFASPCLMASAAVLALSLAAYFIRAHFGGLVFPGFLDATQFPIDTGLWSVDSALMAKLGFPEYAADGGLMAALRVAGTDLTMAYVLPLMQMIPNLISSGLILLCATPILYGALGHLWKVTQGIVTSPSGLVHWYLDLRLTFKSVLVQGTVGLWEWSVQLLCMIPSIALLVFVAQADGNSPVWYVVMALMIAGLLVGYYLSLLLLPVTLLLARAPELSIPAAFSKGISILKNRRKEFFKLSLSFLPWHIVSIFTYGVVDLFLFPYRHLSMMCFLLEVEEMGGTPTLV